MSYDQLADAVDKLAASTSTLTAQALATQIASDAAKDVAISQSGIAAEAAITSTTSRQAAAASAAEANSSKNIAVTSAAAASASAAEALTSKTEAKTSETAAKTSETNAKASETAALPAVAAGLRFCGVSATAPTTRTNGTVLQRADEYQNSVDNLRYSWSGTAWVPLNSSAQSIELALSGPDGPNKIGFGRSKPSPAISSMMRVTSASQYSIWEFDYAITDRTDPDPGKWDWSQAATESLKIARDGVVYWPSYISYRFASIVRVPVNATYWTTHIGNTGLTTIVLDPTIPTAFGFAANVPGDTVRNIRIGGFVVDASKTAGTDGAIIFGGRQNRIEAKGLNYEEIHLFDCRHFGASSDTSTGNFRIGIQMSSIFNSVADAPTVMRNIYIDRMRFEGGITGIYMGAGVPNSNDAPLWMDEIHITDFYHDTLITNAGYPAAGIQIGQDGRGGKLRITRAFCYNGGDVGIEHNGFLDPILIDCHMFNPGSGFWAYNYHALPDYKKQRAVWRDCTVTSSRKNPAWRIGQTRGGHMLLDNCTIFITEESDSRVLDFSASTLQGLESLTIVNMKIFVNTKTKIDYTSLAAALSLGGDFAEYALNIDGLDIYYDGEAPREAHECAALIINSTTPGALVRANIKGFRVHDKRTGILQNSDAIRVYGTAKVVGEFSGMVVDSTVTASASRQGLRVMNGSTPAPEIKIKDSDLSGCTSLYELSTSAAAQRNNVLFDNVKFNQPFDAVTQPSMPTVSVGDYLFKNNKGMPVRAIVVGGTVSALSVSLDGVTFYPLGMVSGAVMIMPNETLRISNTVAPQLRLIVITRLIG